MKTGQHRLHFANFTYREVEALSDDERDIVLLLPVGSVEPHGPHSPLSTDLIISMGMCRRAAERLADDAEMRALILPPLPYGVTRYTARFAGVIHVEEDTLCQMLVDILSSLGGRGFPHNFIVNNHFEPEHIQTLHRAMDVIEERTGIVTGYVDLTRRRRVEQLTEEVREGGSHAGRYETSLVMAERPELIDPAVVAGLPNVPVNLAKMLVEGHKDFTEIGMAEAYNGSPSRATAEEGEQSFEALTGMLIDEMRALVGGVGGRDRPGLYGRI